MENNTIKYYTPSIEEFHVGFEYEVNEHIFADMYNAKNDIPDKWVKCIANSNYLLSGMLKQYEMNSIKKQIYHIRVKYLDKEDIESLGFKCIQEENKAAYKSYWCGFRNKYIEIFVQLHNKYFPRLLNIKSLGNNHIGNFKIKIKNKSELKRLMKQLGIDDISTTT